MVYVIYGHTADGEKNLLSCSADLNSAIGKAEIMKRIFHNFVRKDIVKLSSQIRKEVTV